MKYAFILLITLVSVSFCMGQEHIKKTSIQNLRPTQISLGYFDIPVKLEKLEKKYKKGKLKKYLKEKAIPVVMGPDKMFYLQDGHHKMTALSLSKLIPEEEKIVYLKSIIDKSNLNIEEFADYMVKHHKAYLIDKDGIKRSFFDLPKSLNDMEDDPFRSFSKIIQEAHGYCKTSINYLEFIWGNYFRNSFQKMGISLIKSDNRLLDYKELGLKLAQDKEAKDLPGYLPKGETCP